MEYTHIFSFTHHIFLKSLMINKAMYSEIIFAIRVKGMDLINNINLLK